MPVAVKLARIYGLVQGVNYRSSMQAEAFRLGISGWVRNRQDGTVEALLCGRMEAVELMIEWARRGPPHSRVERVEAEDAAPHQGNSFEVLPTS